MNNDLSAEAKNIVLKHLNDRYLLLDFVGTISRMHESRDGEDSIETINALIRGAKNLCRECER